MLQLSENGSEPVWRRTRTRRRDDQILASNLTLHDLFQKQTSAMLERADLSDEQKQSILIAMSCPCCGTGGFSFTAKLRR